MSAHFVSTLFSRCQRIRLECVHSNSKAQFRKITEATYIVHRRALSPSIARRQFLAVHVQWLGFGFGSPSNQASTAIKRLDCASTNLYKRLRDSRVKVEAVYFFYSARVSRLAVLCNPMASCFVFSSLVLVHVAPGFDTTTCS